MRATSIVLGPSIEFIGLIDQQRLDQALHDQQRLEQALHIKVADRRVSEFRQMDAAFVSRLKGLCPYIYEAGYEYDEPSGLMRRERFLYCFQYGHSLLSTALERVPT